MAAIIVATVCASAAGVATKRHGSTLHAASLNAPAMLVGGLVLMAAALMSGEALRLPRDGRTWAAVSYLALVGSVVSFLVYFSLLKTWNVTSLSFISVFTPAIALGLGFVFARRTADLVDRSRCGIDSGWRRAGAVEIRPRTS
jgi:drug/metabolite transporter (DMT)-like permease